MPAPGHRGRGPNPPMPRHVLLVRLPSGTEYWYVERSPDVGETMTRGATTYVVLSSESADGRTVVTLEPALAAPQESLAS